MNDIAAARSYIPSPADIEKRIAALVAALRPQNDLLRTWALQVIADELTVPVAVGVPGDPELTAEFYEMAAAEAREKASRRS